MRSEKGQVLVIIVLVLVGLLGFAALAIDVGAIYSARRTAQNAADAAAYAGAAKLSQQVKNYTIRSFSCNRVLALLPSAQSSAIERALENDFTIDASVDDNNGVEVICNDSSPSDPFIDVRVVVTQAVDTSFMQVVYDGAAQNVVEAVVRIRPRQLFADGKTIVALRNACGNGTSVYAPLTRPIAQWDGGIEMDGSNDITLIGGGIHSNDCCKVAGTGGTLNISDDGSFTCNGTATYNTSHPPDPMPVPGEDVSHNFNSLIDLVENRCNNMPEATVTVQIIDGVETAVYSVGQHRGSLPDSRVRVDNIKLESGLHCLMDRGAEFNISNNENVTGEKVTIFMDDDTGTLSLLGNGTVRLTPPVANCDISPSDPDRDGCPPAVGGLVILYAPIDIRGGGTPTKVLLGGNSSSYFEGTILAPYNKVEIGGYGQALSNLGAQIIADTVKIHGNVQMTLTWDPDMGIRLPSYMNLEK